MTQTASLPDSAHALVSVPFSGSVLTPAVSRAIVVAAAASLDRAASAGKSTQTVPRLVVLEMGSTPYAGLESYSPFCVKVNRALRVHGLSYERRTIDNFSLGRVNPQKQWPVLLVDDEIVTDSTAILARLESIGARSLLPTDPALRSEAWLWEELADTALNGFYVAARWADEDNWPQVKQAYFADAPAPVRALVAPLLRRRIVQGLVARDVWRAGAEACWVRYGKLLDQLDTRAPEAGFWLGEELCVADLALFAQLHGLRNALTPKQRDRIGKRARLCAYLDRVHEATGVPEDAPLPMK
jgi:glutathione S-transferase